MNTAIPHDPAGWILQEKFDGAFVRWTGTAYLSRNGHRFSPPAAWFIGMPATMIDGELWTQRGDFDGLVSAIQRKRDPWAGVSFVAFDVPVLRVPFSRRVAMLSRLCLPPWVKLAASRVCLSAADLDAEEAAVVSANGEGLVIRHPDSCYRCGDFVKVKRLFPDLDRSIID
jgi:DNA ligase-1